jgi:hypothetical protein
LGCQDGIIPLIVLSEWNMPRASILVFLGGLVAPVVPFLSSVAGGPNTGSVLGSLGATENFMDTTPRPGIAIVLEGATKHYSVTTEEDGKLEIQVYQRACIT